MRLFEKILTIIFFTILGHGCSEPVPVPDARLAIADSLFIIEEDSAATALLEAVNPDSLSSTDYPLYCVLMLQAQDRNDRPMADTLVASAIAHYKHNDEDSYHAGLAWYYMGHVAFYANKPDCIPLYHEALQRFMDAGCDRYTYLSYCFLGKYAYINGVYDIADSVFCNGLVYARKVGKGVYIRTMLQHLAMTNVQAERIERGLAFCDTLRIVSNGSMRTKPFLYRVYAVAAMITKDYTSAKQYCDSIRYFQRVSSNRDTTWLNSIEADLAFYDNRYEKARERYAAMMLDDDIHCRRYGAEGLSRLYERKAVLDSSLKYSAVCLSIVDSIARKSSAVSVLFCRPSPEPPSYSIQYVWYILIPIVMLPILLWVVKRFRGGQILHAINSGEIHDEDTGKEPLDVSCSADVDDEDDIHIQCIEEQCRSTQESISEDSLDEYVPSDECGALNVSTCGVKDVDEEQADDNSIDEVLRLDMDDLSIRLSRISKLYFSKNTKLSENRVIAIFNAVIPNGDSILRSFFLSVGIHENVTKRQLAVLMLSICKMKYDGIANVFSTTKQSVSETLNKMAKQYALLRDVRELHKRVLRYLAGRTKG